VVKRQSSSAKAEFLRDVYLVCMRKGRRPSSVCEHLTDLTAPHFIVDQTFMVVIAVDDLVVSQTTPTLEMIGSQKERG
jgi:hypothetical protein